jgi:hypothetical protein
LDLAFDGTAIFGGPRSKRYAIEIEDGKVKALHVEPDNTGLNGISLQFPSFQILPQKSSLSYTIALLSMVSQLPRTGADFH